MLATTKGEFVSTICQVLEYSRAPVVGGIIKGVKIIGTRSRNGRTYPQAVLRAAKPLYENAPVFLFHPTDLEKRRGSRQLPDHIGSLVNVRERGEAGEITGLYADLVLKQAHPMTGVICESDGREFGLSHNANCVLNDDQTEVLEILRVDSVDLVDDPGTTTNLFEEEDMDLAEMEAATKANSDDIKVLGEGQGKILALLEGMQSKPPADSTPKVKRISALEPVVRSGDKDETLPTYGHSPQDFARGLRGISGGTQQ